MANLLKVAECLFNDNRINKGNVNCGNLFKPAEWISILRQT